jgi:hypothetical protein
MMRPVPIKLLNSIRAALIVLLLVAITWACGSRENDVNALDPAKLADPGSFREGDSFPAAYLPAEVSDWLSYYATLDTGIRIHHLRNSGVPLHIGPLETAGTPQVDKATAALPLLAFSPDSSRAIDFTSYGTFADTSGEGKITWMGGDADQEVILVLVREGKRLQLMFNGPQSSMESAGWLSNNACLVGLIQLDEARQRFYPELMLFNFRDSLFTNFRTPGDFPLDLLNQQPAGYLEQRIRKINPRQP